MPKRVRFQADEDEQEPEFQISTMCDILMSMLVFFVATATKEIQQPVAEVSLPDIINEEQKDKNEFEIYIQEFSGKTSIITKDKDNPHAKAEDLIPELKKELAVYLELKKGGDAQGFRVSIRADKAAAYSVVRDVMKACGKAGVYNVKFATNAKNKAQQGGGS